MNQRDANWDFIVDKIDEEQCVLVLGPEIYKNPDGQLLSTEMVKYLDIENNPNITKYYPSEDLFLFDEAGGKTLACHQIKTFYQKEPPTELLLKLAKIPFNIIITVTQDLILPKAFDKLSIPYQFDFYQRHQEPKSIKTPSKSQPLIYNLLGSIKDEESMVLSHNDMFEYIKSTLSANRMPDKLKLGLQKTRNLILLGLPLDKWYFQLVLRFLDVRSNNLAMKRYAANQKLEDKVYTFYTEQFKMNFVSDDFSDFVDNIYSRCEAKGILRESGDNSGGSVLDRIKNFVADAELETAIDMLKEFLEDADEGLYDEIVGLGGKFRRLQRKTRMGTINSEEESVAMAKITESLLELVNEAKEFE
ncbi:MAG: SIR2 family protein [Bacteroidota bacterium]